MLLFVSVCRRDCSTPRTPWLCPLLVTSGGQIWRPVPTCLLEEIARHTSADIWWLVTSEGRHSPAQDTDTIGHGQQAGGTHPS